MKKQYTIKVGTEFRWSYADSNPLWVVTENRGRGTWIAEVTNDDEDYQGVQSAYTTQQIQAALATDDYWNESKDESLNFYKSLKPGSVVHYNNGFNNYVRCQVMPDKQLCPIALVGDWRDFDLPRRRSDGTICQSYYVEKVKNGELFKPHASNIWEFKTGHAPGDKDPTSMVPLDLSVPPMTQTEEEIAQLWQTIAKIREATNVNHTVDPKDVLKSIKQILNPWANDMGQTT